MKETWQQLFSGKCRARDFNAQIWITTGSSVQYNLLLVVKRFNDYRSLAGLFRASPKDTLGFAIRGQIWLIIIAISARLLWVITVESELLMGKLFPGDEKLTK